MRVPVKSLEPNPYRNIKKYPIDREKVEALKISIDETTFWDNILARPKPGHSSFVHTVEFVQDPDELVDREAITLCGPEFKQEDEQGNEIEAPDDCIWLVESGDYVCYEQPIVQIAYGHHRLIAIQELGIEYVDIPVRVIGDAMMIRIMANENIDDWRSNSTVINETVLAAKNYLDSQIDKCDSWGASNEFIRSLIKDESAWHKVKSTGVGQTTLLKFLGRNWSQYMIQEALETLRDAGELPEVKKSEPKRRSSGGGRRRSPSGKPKAVIDRGAIEGVGGTYRSSQFRKAVKEYGIPVDKQQHIKEVIEKEKVGGRDIPSVVSRFSEKKPEKQGPKLPPDVSVKAREAYQKSEVLYNLITVLAPYTSYISPPSIADNMRRSLIMLSKKINEMYGERKEDENVVTINV